MEIVRISLQVIAALGLFNVWIIRFGKPTPYRGGSARDMKGEFEAYGLPPGVMWLVGTLKVVVAMAFIAGIWAPSLVRPAAMVLVVLMLGAVGMHLKIKDPFRKSLPSLVMLAMALAIAFL